MKPKLFNELIQNFVSVCLHTCLNQIQNFVYLSLNEIEIFNKKWKWTSPVQRTKAKRNRPNWLKMNWKYSIQGTPTIESIGGIAKNLYQRVDETLIWINRCEYGVINALDAWDLREKLKGTEVYILQHNQKIKPSS